MRTAASSGNFLPKLW